MPRRSVAPLFAMLIAGAALLGGCSDDDGGGSDEEAAPYVAALATSLATQEEGALFGAYTEEEAECVAEGVVDAIGVDFLLDNDITADALASSADLSDLGVTLSDEQAQEAAEVVTDCDISFGRVFAGATGTAETIECIDEQVDADAVVASLAAQFQGDDAAFTAAFAPVSLTIQGCFTAG